MKQFLIKITLPALVLFSITSQVLISKTTPQLPKYPDDFALIHTAPKLKKIALGIDSNGKKVLVGITSDGNSIKKFNYQFKSNQYLQWSDIPFNEPTINLQQVDLSEDGTCFVINMEPSKDKREYVLYEKKNSKWSKNKSLMAHYVSASRYMYVLSDGYLKLYSPKNGTKAIKAPNNKFKNPIGYILEASVGTDGEMWCITNEKNNDHAVWKWNNNKWNNQKKKSVTHLCWKQKKHCFNRQR